MTNFTCFHFYPCSPRATGDHILAWLDNTRISTTSKRRLPPRWACCRWWTSYAPLSTTLSVIGSRQRMIRHPAALSSLDVQDPTWRGICVQHTRRAPWMYCCAVQGGSWSRTTTLSPDVSRHGKIATHDNSWRYFGENGNSWRRVQADASIVSNVFCLCADHVDASEQQMLSSAGTYSMSYY